MLIIDYFSTSLSHDFCPRFQKGSSLLVNLLLRLGFFLHAKFVPSWFKYWSYISFMHFDNNITTALFLWIIITFSNWLCMLEISSCIFFFNPMIMSMTWRGTKTMIYNNICDVGFKLCKKKIEPAQKGPPPLLLFPPQPSQIFASPK